MVVEAITLRAYCFYQADNLDKALQYYKEALTRAPDNRSAALLYKVSFERAMRNIPVFFQCESFFNPILCIVESQTNQGIARNRSREL